LLKKQPLDAWLIDVMQRVGPIAGQSGRPRTGVADRPGGTAIWRWAIAHTLLRQFPGAIESRFMKFCRSRSSRSFAALAVRIIFDLAQVAARLAPEYAYRERCRTPLGENCRPLADS